MLNNVKAIIKKIRIGDFDDYPKYKFYTTISFRTNNKESTKQRQLNSHLMPDLGMYIDTRYCGCARKVDVHSRHSFL